MCCLLEVSVTLRKGAVNSWILQGWIKQGLAVLPLPALPDALTRSDLSQKLPLAAQNPETYNGKENLRIWPEFSYLFRNRCYLYNIFHKIWFSREYVSTEGEALELLLFHLCSIATPNTHVATKIPKRKLQIVLH